MAARRPRAKAEALPIDSSVFFKLVRVVNLTSRPFVETLSRRYRLSLNEWRVMVVLASHPGVAARDVVDHTGLDKMSISRALAGLAADGRLERAPDTADARRTRLWLSDAGRTLFQTLGVHATAREQALFAGVSAGEQAQLMRTVDKLIDALQKAEAGPGGASEAEQAGPDSVR